jgi:predicted phosphate transport protein (TIGR00153 family)
MLIFKKEERSRKLILEHLARVFECVAEVRSAVEAYMAGDIEQTEVHTRVGKEREEQADDIKVEIRVVLNSGAFLPQIRADVHGLVDTVDRIADSAIKVASFLRNQKPDIPEQFDAEFQEIYSLSTTCFNELRKALKDYFKPKGKIESLHEHVKRVGQLETDVDRKQAKLERAVFASDLELAHKLQLSQFILLSVDISDRAEYVSDLLESAVMRSVV